MGKWSCVDTQRVDSIVARDGCGHPPPSEGNHAEGGEGQSGLIIM